MMLVNNVNYNNKAVSRFLAMKSASDKSLQRKENTEQNQKTFVSLPQPVFPKKEEKALNILPAVFSFLSLVGVGYLLLMNRSNSKSMQLMNKKVDDVANTFKPIMTGMREQTSKIDELGTAVKNIAIETKSNVELTRQVKGAADYACSRVDHISYMAGKISQDVSVGFNNTVERLGSKIEDVQGMIFKHKDVQQGMKSRVRQLCNPK